MQPLVYLKIILGSEQKHQSHRTFIHGHIPQGASISLTLGDRWLFTFIVSHIKNKKNKHMGSEVTAVLEKAEGEPCGGQACSVGVRAGCSLFVR